MQTSDQKSGKVVRVIMDDTLSVPPKYTFWIEYDNGESETRVMRFLEVPIEWASRVMRFSDPRLKMLK